MKFSVRTLIGIMFVVAGVMKLATIDSFEVYLYSFNIFSYLTTTIISRLLIATEMMLGFGLILKFYYKETWWITLILLVFFTIFLVYVTIFRNDDNCHCFGDVIDLDPKQSIIKNIITILLLFFIRNEKNNSYKPKLKKWLFGISIAISIIIPFILVPNDLIYNKIYSEKENINTASFYESLNDSTYIGYLKVLPEKQGDTIVYVDENQLLDIGEGRYILNYVLAGCKYCKMGAERLTIMFDKHRIGHEKLKFIIGGRPITNSNFIKFTKTYDYDYWKIAQPQLMSITFGRFPLYVFIEDGKIVKAVDFRHLDEKEITEFLK